MCPKLLIIIRNNQFLVLDEFSSVVWHSRLSKKNENDIERVQKSAVKIIMKDNYSDYKNGLKTLGIETLFERREKLCLKFPKKMFKDRKFQKIVPFEEKSA